MKTQELSHLTTLGGALSALGIVFISDRLVGYSFIGAGVLLSIIGGLRQREKPRNNEGKE
jgi:hypothetical protein